MTRLRSRRLAASTVAAAIVLSLSTPSFADDDTNAVTSPGEGDGEAQSQIAEPDVNAQTQVTSTEYPVGEWAGPDPASGPPGGFIDESDGDTTYSFEPDSPSDERDVRTPCSDQPMGHLVKNYNQVKRLHNVPLRCGHFNFATNKGWGYIKLRAKGRWNPWWDGMIGATLQDPEIIYDEGSARRYETKFFKKCDPAYRFVVLTETRMKSDQVMGIITAYKQYS